MDLFEPGTNVFEKEIAMSEEWLPNDLPERREEAEKISDNFRRIIRNLDDDSENVDACNVFLSGKTGQGKTVTTRVVLDDLNEAVSKKDGELDIFEVSLHDINTSYQAVAKILAEIEEGTEVPPSGVAKSKLNIRMFNCLDQFNGHVILFLDEIDNLGSDDDILYQLTRARSNSDIENSHVSIIGISNDLEFSDRLSAKTRDSLNKTEIHFGAYDADDLRSILKKRVSIAFKENAVDEAAIAKTAAIAARDTGSARQAIQILYEAGDLACKWKDDVVESTHIEEAHDNIEEVNITNTLKDMTVNDQALLLSLAILESRDATPARTKEVYSEYKRVTNEVGMEKLTMRSIREKLSNLDTYNLALVHERSAGLQGGKHYVSELSTDIDSLLDGFMKVDRFKETAENIDNFSNQSTLS